MPSVRKKVSARGFALSMTTRAPACVREHGRVQLVDRNGCRPFAHRRRSQRSQRCVTDAVMRQRPAFGQPTSEHRNRKA
jgi:hypothetical protein